MKIPITVFGISILFDAIHRSVAAVEGLNYMGNFSTAWDDDFDEFGELVPPELRPLGPLREGDEGGQIGIMKGQGSGIGAMDGGASGLLAALGSISAVVGAVTGIIQPGIDIITSALGIVNAADSAYRSLYNMLVTTKDILELLGLNKKLHILLVDRDCGDCNLWVRCFSRKWHTAWHEIDEDEGYIIKFVTRIPDNWQFLNPIGRWQCEFKDGENGRVSKADAYGGKAPKDLWNMYICKKKKIVRVDYETKRIDGLAPPIYWRP